MALTLAFMSPGTESTFKAPIFLFLMFGRCFMRLADVGEILLVYNSLFIFSSGLDTLSKDITNSVVCPQPFPIDDKELIINICNYTIIPLTLHRRLP